jgi:hypothetical protein
MSEQRSAESAGVAVKNRRGSYQNSAGKWSLPLHWTVTEPLLQCILCGEESGLHIFLGDIEMSHQSHALSPHRTNQNSSITHRSGKLYCRPDFRIEFEEYEVCFNGCGDPYDAGKLLKSGRQLLSVTMIVGQSIDMMLQGMDGCGRQHTSLSQATTEQFTNATGLCHVCGTADQHGAYRAAKALGKTDGDGIEAASGFDRLSPRGNQCVEQPRTVKMTFETCSHCPVTHTLHLLQRIHTTTSEISGVFKTNQPRTTEVLIIDPNTPLKIRDIKHSTMAVESSDGNATECGWSTSLEIADMTAFMNQQLVTRDTVQSHGHLVALSTRAGEDCGFTTKQFSHLSLEPIDSRVFTHHIIANLSFKHRPAHGWSRASYCITAKIDQPHTISFPARQSRPGQPV